MLETVFTIFAILFLISAVCITAILAIISYPFAAFINYSAWLLKNTKNPTNDNAIVIKKINDKEKE
jgi:hypothetical protein